MRERAWPAGVPSVVALAAAPAIACTAQVAAPRGGK
jgi:hypothetical protein